MKNYFSGAEEIRKVDRRDLEKDFSTQKRALLGLLFQIDGKSLEDPCNFSKVPGVITRVRDAGRYVRTCSRQRTPYN